MPRGTISLKMSKKYFFVCFDKEIQLNKGVMFSGIPRGYAMVVGEGKLLISQVCLLAMARLAILVDTPVGIIL